MRDYILLWPISYEKKYFLKLFVCSNISDLEFSDGE